MALSCNKCLNTHFAWSKDVDKNTIATCQHCGTEIFLERKGERQEGDACMCGGRIVLRESPFKKSKLKKPYYYTAYYWCPLCRKMFMSEKFKVYNKL